MGILYGVSVGAGDPELLTVKAVRVLEKCRVIAAPDDGLALSIAGQAVNLSGKEIVRLSFPMTKDRAELEISHEKAAEALTAILEKEDAAFVCLGDISVYSTFHYISERVRQRGFKVECVAGVTSFCAAAAALGIPLVSGKEPLVIIPAHCESRDALLSADGTRVVMKGAADLTNVRGKIYAAENVGLGGERLFFPEDEISDTGYFTSFIIKNE